MPDSVPAASSPTSSLRSDSAASASPRRPAAWPGASRSVWRNQRYCANTSAAARAAQSPAAAPAARWPMAPGSRRAGSGTYLSSAAAALASSASGCSSGCGISCGAGRALRRAAQCAAHACTGAARGVAASASGSATGCRLQRFLQTEGPGIQGPRVLHCVLSQPSGHHTYASRKTRWPSLVSSMQRLLSHSALRPCHVQGDRRMVTGVAAHVQQAPHGQQRPGSRRPPADAAATAAAPAAWAPAPRRPCRPRRAATAAVRRRLSASWSPPSADGARCSSHALQLSCCSHASARSLWCRQLIHGPCS